MHPLVKVSLIELNKMFDGTGLSHPLNINKTKDVMSWIKDLGINLLDYQDEIIHWLKIHQWNPDHIRQVIHICMEIQQKHGAETSFSSSLSPNFFSELMDKALAFNVYFYLSGLQKLLFAYTNQGPFYLKAKKFVFDQIDFSINELIKNGYEVRYGEDDREHLMPLFFKNNVQLDCLIAKIDTLQAEQLIADNIR